MMNPRFEEKAEKMRKKREERQFRHWLTEKQKKIRQLISKRNSKARIRAARAAKDEKYRARLEASSNPGGKGMRTPKAWLSELAAEEMKTRRAIQQKASNVRLPIRTAKSGNCWRTSKGRWGKQRKRQMPRNPGGREAGACVILFTNRCDQSLSDKTDLTTCVNENRISFWTRIRPWSHVDSTTNQRRSKRRQSL